MLEPLAGLPGIRTAYRVASSCATRLLYPSVRIPKDARILGIPIISCAQGSTIRIGHRFVAISHPVFNAIGVSSPCVLRTVGRGAEMVIGDDVGISGASIVCASKIVIGDRSMLGSGVVVMDSDLHPLGDSVRRYGSGTGPAEPVVIGRDVFVGARAMILKGVSVGHGAVIGAGSVVTRDVRAGDIVAGVPAVTIDGG